MDGVWGEWGGTLGVNPKFSQSSLSSFLEEKQHQRFPHVRSCGSSAWRTRRWRRRCRESRKRAPLAPRKASCDVRLVVHSCDERRRVGVCDDV